MHRPRVAIALCLSVLLAVVAVPVAPPDAEAVASTYYVDDDGDNGNAGTLASPWRTIEFAIAQALSGDTIKVLPGLYEADAEQDFPIRLPAGVTLESTDGYQTTTIGAGEASSRVIEIDNATANTVVRGFTLRAGGEADGSAIKVLNDSATNQGWPLIEECRFDHNNAIGNNGGAICCAGTFLDGTAMPLIRNNRFDGNQAARGGAIYCQAYSAPIIEGNLFWANSASDRGGAIAVEGNTNWVVINGNRFVGNWASGLGGGALHLTNNNAQSNVIRGNTFESNHTTADGGAVLLGGFATETLEGNRFISNWAEGTGGAVASCGNAGQALDLASSNNLYAQNYSGQSGVVYLEFTNATLTNDTVCENSAVATGWPGIYRDSGSAGSLTVTNCIMGGHVDDFDVYGGTVSDSITGNANLGSLGNTVGTNVLVGSAGFLDASGYDYRLKVGSLGIDVGSNAAAPATDFEGNARPQDGDGNGSAVVDMGYWERPDLEIGRAAGADRYATAALLAQSAFDSAETVVLASGQGFPDALSAAGLCGALDAPLLLSKTTSLPAATQAALDVLTPSAIYLVGGTGVISGGVQAALEGAGYTVTRISGPDRYATSAEVAREVAAIRGDFLPEALFARGDEFPDALAAAPLAYARRMPIILVRPGSLPSVVSLAIDNLDIMEGAVLGGTGAVSSVVQGDIDTLLLANGGDATDRWDGTDRYATAVRIAEESVGMRSNAWSYVGIATGTDFPDALAGGVAVGARNGVMLLTKSTSLPAPTAGALAVHGDVVVWCDICGGSGAVSPGVESAIHAALGW